VTWERNKFRGCVGGVKKTGRGSAPPKTKFAVDLERGKAKRGCYWGNRLGRSKDTIKFGKKEK